MRATIISIGNELLIGDTINTNAAWCGRFLTENGFSVDRILTIPDDYQVIIDAVSDGLDTTELVITTGGLGPTHDDITKKAVADLFDSKLVLDDKVLKFIKDRFKMRGIPFSKSNYDQAMVPDKSTVLFNEQGTAPGMWFKTDHSALAILPGVPHEMRYLMDHGVLDEIHKAFKKREIHFITYIRTAGIGESSLSDDILGELTAFLNEGNQIAFLPGNDGVTLRISTRADSDKNAEKKLAPLYSHILQSAGDHIFGEGRQTTLNSVTGELLRESKLCLSVAESCTGGMLSNSITDIPGCSEYFRGSVVAYSNELKNQILGVSESTLQAYGAVSKHTAIEMATGIKFKTGSHIGVSTTGIAGPGGGSAEKPVGLIWMGFSFPDDTFALKIQLTNDRLLNKKRTATIVLDTLRRRLRNYTSFPYGLIPERI